MTRCAHYGQLFQPTRRQARFCSTAHRKRAKRRRDAMLAECAYPTGAGRGRVPLTEPTEAERQTDPPGLRIVPTPPPLPTDPLRERLDAIGRNHRSAGAPTKYETAQGMSIAVDELNRPFEATSRYPTVTTWLLPRLTGNRILSCMWRLGCAVVLMLGAWAWAKVQRGNAVDEGEALARLLSGGPGSL